MMRSKPFNITPCLAIFLLGTADANTNATYVYNSTPLTVNLFLSIGPYQANSSLYNPYGGAIPNSNLLYFLIVDTNQNAMIDGWFLELNALTVDGLNLINLVDRTDGNGGTIYGPGTDYVQVNPNFVGASFTEFALTSESGSWALVPEPSTWAMMILGFAGLGFAGYRRTRKPVSIAAQLATLSGVAWSCGWCRVGIRQERICCRSVRELQPRRGASPQSRGRELQRRDPPR